MAARFKSVLVVLAGGVALLVGTLVAAGVLAAGTGLVRIYVLEKKPGGDHVNLMIPAALVPLGMKLLPAKERQRAAAQLEPWLPAIEAASRQLARVPDAVLVEVESRDERVSIRKLGGALVIDVDSPQESVHLSVPLKLFAAVASEFQAALPVAVSAAALERH